MQDITMCKNFECPQADNCWRLGCPPSLYQQAYQVYVPEVDDEEDFACSHFINYPKND